LRVTRGDVEFDHVGFSYKPENPVLRDVSLSIGSGEKVALVGRSGAGKSTIASLLLGFFRPGAGEIRIDGQDIGKVSLESLRGQIGMVWQDVLLREARRKAGLLDFVNSLPQGMDTVVGQGGQGLSGGQKQRLAMARVFLKDPKILVFDEATSSFESEQAVKDSWNELSEGRTMLIIAHRLSTIRDADRVAVLAGGRLIACGRHSGLLGSCAEYDELCAAQLGKGAVV
jgi:ABC-type multidrug transport system fused ATPase/permease subunit